MYCNSCGAYVSHGIRFCPSCGKDAQTGETGQSGGAGGHTGGNNAEPIAMRNADVLGVFCYMGPLLIIPYIIRPDSDFIKYHTNQGLLLLLTLIICLVVMIVPIIGWLAGLVGEVFSVICFIIGIVNVLNGRMKPLPIIGKRRIL